MQRLLSERLEKNKPHVEGKQQTEAPQTTEQIEQKTALLQSAKMLTPPVV